MPTARLHSITIGALLFASVARRLKKERHGALVLFLDKERKPRWDVDVDLDLPVLLEQRR